MKLRARAWMAAASLSLALASVSSADNVVGYNSLSVPAGTDVYLCVPFTQDKVGEFTVATVTGSGVTVASPLSANYATLYYVRFTSGTNAGKWSTISNNTTSSTTITFADTAILTGLTAGDKFCIIPHNTLASVFPDNMKGISFAGSNSQFALDTAVYFLPTTIGKNKSAAATYYFLNSASQWRQFGAGTANKDNVVIPPQYQFIIRATTTPITYYSLGDVENNAKQVKIVRSVSTDNDNILSADNALPTTLAGLNLAGTSAFSDSTSQFNLISALYVYDNTVNSFNKSASATYYTVSGHWRKFGAGATNFDTQPLPPGATLIIRQKGTADATTFWSQPSPGY
ncbi:MAG: TIGR02597 family protein [Phycisphaera sp.]|nr:TIGR02597 family protein [Phycisphaera sp.]